MNTSNALIGRDSHTAVWTGTEMIVWGGIHGSTCLNDGARYNPATDRWTPVGSNGVPSVRSDHTAIWTGSEMIVWGGTSPNQGNIKSGGRYNPASDGWRATDIASAPAARYFQTANWTGNQMIIWGGGAEGGSCYCAAGGTTPPPHPPPPQCTYSLSSSSDSFRASGGSGAVNLSAPRDCPWSASTPARWIRVSASSTAGDGVVSYWVDRNTTGSTRIATIRMGDQTFTVTQKRR